MLQFSFMYLDFCIRIYYNNEKCEMLQKSFAERVLPWKSNAIPIWNSL